MSAAKLERRAVVMPEVRTQGRRLVGLAALYNWETRIGDKFTEVIKAGAFDRALADRRDILALVDHDASRLLARTSSGTLRLTTEARGLAFEIDVPDTTDGRDVLALAERGDLGGMSFGFSVPAGGQTWTGDRRELRAIDLVEVSVVLAWPAYEGTTVEARKRAMGGFDRRRLLTVMGG